MDPLSISASVAGLTASCVQTAKALHDLKDKFDNANLTISAICTETTLISASMSHIQSHLLRDPDSVSDKLNSQPSLESTLDQALTGCYVVFDVLQSEVSKLTESALVDTSVDFRFATKIRYMWSEATMKDLLNQMRGLQTALTVLLQLLGVDTITELKQMMDQNMAILGEVAQHTSRISASSNKASRAPRSIYDMSFKTLSISEDGASLYSSKMFEFDDEVVNSTVYRQVLAKAYAHESSTGPERTNDTTEGQKEGVVPSDSDTHSISGTSTPTLRSGGESEENGTAAITKTSSPFIITGDPFKEFLEHKLSNIPAWEDLWSLKPEDLTSVPKREIQRQNLLHEVIATERAFLKQVQVIHYLYYYRLALHPSTVVSRGSNQEFAEKYFTLHNQFYSLHKTLLYEPLVERQKAEGPWTTNFPDIFERWLVEATPVYLEFSALYPHLRSAVEDEAAKNARFALFLQQSMDHEVSSRLPWSTYMKAPIIRLQRYTLLLGVGLKSSDPANERHGYHATKSLIGNIQDLAQKCDIIVSGRERQVRVDRLSAQLGPVLSGRTISRDADILFDQDLSHQKRGFRGSTQFRVVVLGSAPHPNVLVLNKVSKLKGISGGEDSYELVKQFDSQNPEKLHITLKNDYDKRFVLTLSQSSRQPDLTLTTASYDNATELLDAVKAIGGSVETLT